MGIFGQILLGLILIVAGVLTLIKNYQLANSMPLRWLEGKLGPGSSYPLWKVFSVLLVFAGLSVMFGFSHTIISWLLSPLTHLINPGGTST